MVSQPGAAVADPDRWQPLQIAQMMSQNGIPLENGVQTFVSPHWGRVTGFALPPGGEAGTPIDPGPPPRVADPATSAEAKAGVLDVIRYSSRLDPADGATIDASPGAMGANPLGTYDGQGSCGEPGDRRAVRARGRAAGGTTSGSRRSSGPTVRGRRPRRGTGTCSPTRSPTGSTPTCASATRARVDRLEWDVTLYLALNGATHDAAVAAWGSRARTTRPGRSRSSATSAGSVSPAIPALPSYDPRGLPLEPGLVEVVTAESSAPGQPHEAFAGQVGTVVVRSWAGRPKDPENETGGVRWIRAVDWLPYQMPTFVTPAFAGYVSGHSTFSRASAEVLTAMTGSPYFPGGLVHLDRGRRARWTSRQGRPPT